MDAGQKSIGTLIDELLTVSQKCFRAQDNIGSNDDQKALAAARAAQDLNRRRCELIRAIDQRLGEGSHTMTPKTY